jgi:hypothetical protein
MQKREATDYLDSLLGEEIQCDAIGRAKSWPVSSGTCGVCCWRTSWNVDPHSTPTGSASCWRARERKRPGIRSNDVVLVSDNARPHTAQPTRNLLKNFVCETLDNLSYSPFWHLAISIRFAPSRSICQDMVLPAFKMSNVLPSHDRRTTGTCVLCVRDGQI